MGTSSTSRSGDGSDRPPQPPKITRPLPPAYTRGAQDYHNMLALHPPETWMNPEDAGGIARETVS
jgi:hypothetical protein